MYVSNTSYNLELQFDKVDHQLFGRRVDDEDRTLAVVQHVVTNAAQDGASYSAQSTRPHDGQVSHDVTDDVNDDVAGFQASFYAGDDVRRGHL